MSIPMIDCPFCRNEVPAGAPRCKDCFNDLSEYKPVQIKGLVVGVILLALVFGAAGMWSWQTHYNHGQLGNAIVDKDQNRVVLIYTSTMSRPSTQQLAFDDIASVELVARDFVLAGSMWEVFLVTSNSERILMKLSTKKSLESYAASIAQQLNKQLTIVNKIRSGTDFFGNEGG